MNHFIPGILATLCLSFLIPTVGAQEVKVTSNISYTTAEALNDYEKERCKLDLYVAEGKSRVPVLVWFHGGALKEGDKADAATSAVCRALAAEGLLVASVNYRLSPQVKAPAYIEDAAAAVAWVLQNAEQHGGDAERIYISGHSAGGYLAAMVAMDERLLARHKLHPSKLAGVIPVAGQMITHSTVREEREVPKTTIVVDEFAPVHFARKSTPPFLLLFAENDLPLRGEENRFFAAAMRVAGNSNVALSEVAEHDHGGIGNRIAERDSPVRQLIANFIRANASELPRPAETKSAPK